MARCLNPRMIPNPAVWEKRQLKFLRDKPALFRYGRDNLRPMLSEIITVPCGKCLACLKNKQSSMVVRCRREAEQRGSFAFMTLTYDDDHMSDISLDKKDFQQFLRSFMNCWKSFLSNEISLM